MTTSVSALTARLHCRHCHHLLSKRDVLRVAVPQHPLKATRGSHRLLVRIVVVVVVVIVVVAAAVLVIVDGVHGEEQDGQKEHQEDAAED
jgi:hypothetical protein